MPFPDNKEDLNVFVDDLSEQMERRFSIMTSSIISKLDEMGRRVDELERDLNSLAGQAGIEAAATATTASGSQRRSSKEASPPQRLSPARSPPSAHAVEI